MKLVLDVMQGKQAERCTKSSPGTPIRQRHRLMTPPLRVLTAAVRELAPKTCISRDSSTPGAETKRRLRKEDISHYKPNQGHTDLTRKEGGGIRTTDPTKRSRLYECKRTGGRLCAVVKEQPQLRILKTPLWRGKPIGCPRGISRASKSVS